MIRKEFNSYDEFDTDIIHDAVFSIMGIDFSKATKTFKLICFTFLNEIYEVKKIFPCISLNKYKRRKTIIFFQNIEDMEKTIIANLDWYSINTIKYKNSQIIFKTDGCVNLSLYSDAFSGYIELTDEIVSDSMGYVDISLRNPFSLKKRSLK